MNCANIVVYFFSVVGIMLCALENFNITGFIFTNKEIVYTKVEPYATQLFPTEAANTVVFGYDWFVISSGILRFLIVMAALIFSFYLGLKVAPSAKAIANGFYNVFFIVVFFFLVSILLYDFFTFSKCKDRWPCRNWDPSIPTSTPNINFKIKVGCDIAWFFISIVFVVCGIFINKGAAIDSAYEANRNMDSYEQVNTGFKKIESDEISEDGERML